MILHELLAFYSAFLNIRRSDVLTALAWLVPYETTAVSAQVLCTPYNHAPYRFMQSHISKEYACLAVTCHLHFWQNDRDLLRATAVTRRWNGHRNKSQHRKSTLENTILPPFHQGFEPATFQSRIRRSNHWAIPAPTELSSSNHTQSFHIICADPKTSNHEIKTKLVPATDLAPRCYREGGGWRREKERNRKEGGAEKRGVRKRRKERRGRRERMEREGKRERGKKVKEQKEIPLSLIHISEPTRPP